jgi:hypothetical protein
MMQEMLGQFMQAMQAQNEANQQAVQAMIGQIAAGQQQLAQAITAPKEIIYRDGRPVGSRPVVETMQ